MSSTLLLVHDDIAAIATLRRLLTRAGHEVVLATSAADALIAFGHHQPALIILSPLVESGRGRVVLEELANHPDGPRARVVLLGHGIDGFFAPVVPLPLDGATFLELIARALAGEAEGWRVLEKFEPPVAAAPPPPGEPWRATVPAQGEPALESALFGDLPPMQDSDWTLASEDRTQLVTRPQLAPETDALVQQAMAEAERDLEAHTMASIQVPPLDEPTDPEVTSLEIRPDAATENPLEQRLAFESARALKALEMVETLRGELQTLREQFAGSVPAAEVEALRGRITDLALELDSARNAHPESDDSEAETLKARIAELEQSLAAAKAETSASAQRETQQADEGAAAQEAFAAERAQVARVLAEKDGRLAEAEKALAAEKSRASAAAAESKKSGERIAELEKERAEEKSRVEHAEGAIVELEKQLAALEAELSQEHEKAAETGKELDVLRSKARETEGEAKARITELEDAHQVRADVLAASEARAKGLEAERDEVKSARDRVTAEAKALRTRGEMLENRLTEALTQATQLEARLIELESTHEQTLADLGAWQTRSGDLEQRLNQLSLRMSDGEAQWQSRVDELESAQGQMLAERTAWQLRAEELEPQLSESTAELAQVRERLEAEEKRAAELEKKLAASEAKTAEEHARFEAEEKRASELEEKLATSEARTAEEHGRFEAEEKRASELEQKLAAETEQHAAAAEKAREQLEAATARADALEQKLAAESEQHAAAAEKAREQLEAATARGDELEQKLAAESEQHAAAAEKAREQLEAATARGDELEQKLAAETEQHAAAAEKAREQLKEATSRGGDFEQKLANETERREATQARVEELEQTLQETRGQLASVNAEAEADRTRLTGELTALQAAKAETEAALSRTNDELRATLEQRDAEIAELKERARNLELSLAEAKARGMKLDGALSALKEASQAEQALHRKQVEALEAALAAEKNVLAETRSELEQSRAATEAETAARTERETELEAARAEIGKLKTELENAVVPLLGPKREAWSVPTQGNLPAAELARLVRRLGAAEVEVRLELKAAGSMRILWLRGGRLVAASSDREEESLLDRAQRDGLLDTRQVRELKLLRAGSDVALLSAMRGRGLLRDAEVVPLCQRQLERLAIEALAEPETVYRIAKGQPPEDALPVAAVRPLDSLIAEALRRTMGAVDVSVALLRSVVAVRADREVFAQAGFGEREQSFLLSADGEATVQSLVLASGLRSDTAVRLLSVAQALELIELRAPPEGDGGEPPDDLEVERLSAKYDSSIDADYFTVLGLSRGAGADEVGRAFETLREEFHPLRFAGHPDARLQRKAEQLQALFSEAAQALADERLRAEYARNLAE